MAGRRPKTNVLRMLNGNAGHRPLNENEPVATPGWPPEPSGLSAAGRAEWRRLASLLEDEQRLTLSDGPTLQGAAVAYEQALWYTKRRDRSRLPEKDRRMYASGSRAQWDAYRKFVNDMCLSAGTRAKAKVGGRGTVTGKLAGFIGGKS